MKKTYMQPTVKVCELKPRKIICASVYGVTGTGTLNTDLSDDDTTDEYLAPSFHGVFD